MVAPVATPSSTRITVLLRRSASFWPLRYSCRRAVSSRCRAGLAAQIILCDFNRCNNIFVIDNAAGFGNCTYGKLGLPGVSYFPDNKDVQRGFEAIRDLGPGDDPAPGKRENEKVALSGIVFDFFSQLRSGIFFVFERLNSPDLILSNKLLDRDPSIRTTASRGL